MLGWRLTWVGKVPTRSTQNTEFSARQGVAGLWMTEKMRYPVTSDHRPLAPQWGGRMDLRPQRKQQSPGLATVAPEFSTIPFSATIRTSQWGSCKSSYPIFTSCFALGFNTRQPVVLEGQLSPAPGRVPLISSVTLVFSCTALPCGRQRAECGE